MKNLIACSLMGMLILTSSLSVQAQPPKNFQEKKEHIEALKVSFITQKLDLTREEAQRFWPIYNEYHDALDSLRKARRDEFKNYRDQFDQLSEKELTDLVDKQIIYRQRELDLMKKYHAEFKSVLPIKKVALLYRAEDEFRAKVLQEIKNRN